MNLDPVDALWLMDADGSHMNRLTKTPGNGWAFWNARGHPTAGALFLAKDDGHHDAWVIDADGANSGTSPAVGRMVNDPAW